MSRTQFIDHHGTQLGEPALLSQLTNDHTGLAHHRPSHSARCSAHTHTGTQSLGTFSIVATATIGARGKGKRPWYE
jgi:hypothetical protein